MGQQLGQLLLKVSPNLQPFSLLELSDELVFSLAARGEVDSLEARAPVQQLDQPRHGDGASATVHIQATQIGQAVQVGQARVADVGLNSEIKHLKRQEALQVSQARVADVVIEAEIKRLKRREALQVGQARVADVIIVAEIKRLKRREALQVGQARVSNTPTTEAVQTKIAKRRQVSDFSQPCVCDRRAMR